MTRYIKGLAAKGRVYFVALFCYSRGMGLRQSSNLLIASFLTIFLVVQGALAEDKVSDVMPEIKYPIPANLPVSEEFKKFESEKKRFDVQRKAGRDDFEKQKLKRARDQKVALEDYKKMKAKKGWASYPETTPEYQEYLKERKAKKKEREKDMVEYHRTKKKNFVKRTRPEVLADMEELGILERDPKRVDSTKRLYVTGTKSKGASSTGSAPSFGSSSSRPSFPTPSEYNDFGEGAPFEGDDFIPPPPPPGGMGEYIEPELPPPPPPPPGDFDFDSNDGF
ncbi:MAG: hypothetical protein AB7O96_10640 [Pseudobdellovibrionaceae bacterium]